MLIKTKIIVSVAFMSIFMIVIGIIGLSGFKQGDDALQNVYSVNMKNSIILNKINGLMRANRIQLLLALQHDPGNEFSSLHEHPTSAHTDLAKKYSNEIEELWKEYYRSIQTEDGKKLAEKFNTERQKYEHEGLNAASKAVLSGDFHETYRITFDVINPSIIAANKSLDALLDYELTLSKKAHDEAASRSSKYRIIIISACIIAVLVGGSIGIIIARSIDKITSKIRNAANNLSSGDFTIRLNLPGKDELSTVAASFDQMAEEISQIVSKIAMTTADVSASAAQVHTTSEEMVRCVENVSNQATTVATAGEEMAATSGDIAHNCLMAADSSHLVTDEANKGVKIIEKSISVMNSISERVSTTAATVETLGQRSDQIGEIVGTIEDIADQTNLLALNAAIEAARAGEQGRGFAVVADEVRALAERTTKATREIGDMIKAIQTETRDAVSAMEEGVKEVEKGTMEAAKSGEAMNLILDQISNLSMQVSQIATAAEEQTATTSEISSSILSINEVAETASSSAHLSASEANNLNLHAESLTSLLAGLKIDESVTLCLRKAKSAHLIFIGKIKAHLDGTIKIDPNQLATHLNCAFGKWYQTKGMKNCGQVSSFREIDAPHAKVHEYGKQAVLSYNSGDRQGAEKHCQEMVSQSTILLNLLEDLEKRCV